MFIGNQDIDKAYGGVSVVPTTFIIDKSGNIVDKIIGSKTKEEFEKIINKFL